MQVSGNSKSFTPGKTQSITASVYKPVTLQTAQAAASSAGKTLSELTLALTKPQSSPTTAVSEPSHGDDSPKFASIGDAVQYIQSIAATHEKEELKSITNEQGLVKEVQKQMQDPARSTYKQLAEIEGKIRSNQPVDSKIVRELYNELKCRLYEIQLRDQSVTGLKDATDEPFTDAKVGKTGRAREVFDHNQHAAEALFGSADAMRDKSQHELYFEGNMKWLEKHFPDLNLGQDDGVLVSEVRSRSGSFVDDDGRSSTSDRTIHGAPLLTRFMEHHESLLSSLESSLLQTSELISPPVGGIQFDSTPRSRSSSAGREFGGGQTSLLDVRERDSDMYHNGNGGDHLSESSSRFRSQSLLGVDSHDPTHSLISEEAERGRQTSLQIGNEFGTGEND